MQVKDIMQTQIISVQLGTTLSQLLNIFKDFHSFPIVPVTNKEQTLLGIVQMRSLFDIFQPYHHNILMHNPLSMLSQETTDIFDIDIDENIGFLIIIADIIDKKVVSIQEDKDIKQAYDLMQLHKRDTITVIDQEHHLKGIISSFDIVMSVFKEKGIF
ncbi:MAG: hypothetical protein DRP78_02735 [Candidatus Omnitrophota bacterium]|nr:MAG: hypothetical protein DRP78_02735 [Candidatus Omnitrophota bacterium]